MNISKIYYFVYYKLYKMSEAAPSKWLSDWKASLAMDVIAVFIAFSCINYYSVLSHKFIDFGSGRIFSMFSLLLICLPNYFIFNYNDRWKIIIKEFDRLPKKKNRIWGAAVWIFITLVLINTFISFELLFENSAHF